jgi:hypothetical protein
MSHNVIAFTCSHCEETLYVPDFLSGISGPCPHCGTMTSSPSRVSEEMTEPQEAESSPADELFPEWKETEEVEESMAEEKGVDFSATVDEDWSSNPLLLDQWKMSWNDPPPTPADSPGSENFRKKGNEPLPRLRPVTSHPSNKWEKPLLEQGEPAASEIPSPTEPVVIESLVASHETNETSLETVDAEAPLAEELAPAIEKPSKAPKVKVKKIAGLSYYLPAAEGFESYIVPAKSGRPEKTISMEVASHVGIPVRDLLSLPVANPSDDPVVDRGLAKLEWEGRGVKVPFHEDGLIHDPSGWVAILGGVLPVGTESWANSQFAASLVFPDP